MKISRFSTSETHMELKTHFRLWIALTTLDESSCHFQKGIERRSSSTVVHIRASVSKGSLKDGWIWIATIKENFASLDSYILTLACRRLRRRVEAVIDAGGDFIQWSNSHIPNLLPSFLNLIKSLKLTILCSFVYNLENIRGYVAHPVWLLETMCQIR